MIWLTWRQFRTQALVVLGGIALLSAVLAATGPRLVHLHDTRGNRFIDDLGAADGGLYAVACLAVLALPAVIGMFWGAPLITRELDAGTHRLAWTLTTRRRWLATKLGLVGLTAMVAGGLLSFAVSWWAAPIDAAVAVRNGRPGPGIFVFARMSREMFDSRGIVPIGYAAFAFVLGATLGVLIRRTLPSMAVLLALFVTAQITMSVAVRPHLIAPERVTTPITAENLTFIGIGGRLTLTIDEPGAWITSQRTIGATGRPARVPSSVMNCPLSGAKARECFGRITALGYRQQVDYQPAGRFWALQAYETAIYLVLALLLAGACGRWVHRRLS
jgi:hypothetical protein